MIQYQTFASGERTDFSIGFDSNILMDGIYKIIQGIELSLIEKNSLKKAKVFLESILDFCNGSHRMNVSGLSGGEAFSIFVNSLKFDGNIEKLKELLEEYITVFNQLEGRVKINEDQIGLIISTFESISEYINNELLINTTSKINGWRI
jgi:hypothetical protein